MHSKKRNSYDVYQLHKHILTLPVPDSPHRTTTPPPLPPSLFLTVPKISSATASGDLPKTSIVMYSSGTKVGSRTPLSLAISIPFFVI